MSSSQETPKGFLTVRMPKKFAIYEFIEDDSVAIGKTELIVDSDNYKLNNYEFDFTDEIYIEWPGVDGSPAEKYVAKVLKFGDTHESLVQDCKRAEHREVIYPITPLSKKKRVRRVKEQYTPSRESDSEDSCYTPTRVKNKENKKKTGNRRNQTMQSSIAGVLQSKVQSYSTVRNRILQQEVTNVPITSSASSPTMLTVSAPVPSIVESATVGTVSAPVPSIVESATVGKLQRRIRELEDIVREKDMENIRLRAMMVEGLQSMIKKIDPGEASSSSSQPTENPFAEWGLTHAKIAQLSADPEKKVGELMQMMWRREHLATRSLTGVQCHVQTGRVSKPQLTPTKLHAITDYVVSRHAHVAGINRAVKRAAARTMNNAATAYNKKGRQ